MIRLADPTNHTQIDDEISDLNRDWDKKLSDLENHIEVLTVLSNHWKDFERRVESLQSQLNDLEEKNINTEVITKSKQHLLDTNDIYQVRNRVLKKKSNLIQYNEFMPWTINSISFHLH